MTIGILNVLTTCIQQVIISSMQHDSMTYVKKNVKCQNTSTLVVKSCHVIFFVCTTTRGSSACVTRDATRDVSII
jgi:hypothetical protein